MLELASHHFTTWKKRKETNRIKLHSLELCAKSNHEPVLVLNVLVFYCFMYFLRAFPEKGNKNYKSRVNNSACQSS